VEEGGEVHAACLSFAYCSCQRDGEEVVSRVRFAALVLQADAR
jgi:hypothetical protein